MGTNRPPAAMCHIGSRRSVDKALQLDGNTLLRGGFGNLTYADVSRLSYMDPPQADATEVASCFAIAYSLVIFHRRVTASITHASWY